MPTKQSTIGSDGERIARRHLQMLGHRVLDHNFTTRVGELDIVSLTKRTLVFSEVKTRRVTTEFIDLDSYGINPVESVTATKQLRIRRAAHLWIERYGDSLKFRELRYDTVSVIINAEGKLLSLEQLEAAF